MSAALLTVVAATSGASVASKGGAPAIWLLLSYPGIFAWGLFISSRSFSPKGEMQTKIAHFVLGAYLAAMVFVAVLLSGR